MRNNKKKLTLIIPVYNEEKTLKKIISKALKKEFGLEKEIIVVNDGSTDKSLNKIKKIKNKKIKIISYEKNKGKGYAIRKGIEISTGDIIAIQDADLEYNLNDLKKLVNTLIREDLNVIYGSRFLKKNNFYKKNSFYWGNRFLSLLTSLLYLKKITDMETCYKVFKKEVIKNLELKSDGFEIEPEITSKILKKKYKIKEIPISYRPRKKDEGKKIKWRDGFIALKILIKERIKK